MEETPGDYIPSLMPNSLPQCLQKIVQGYSSIIVSQLWEHQIQENVPPLQKTYIMITFHQETPNSIKWHPVRVSDFSTAPIENHTPLSSSISGHCLCHTYQYCISHTYYLTQDSFQRDAVYLFFCIQL